MQQFLYISRGMDEDPAILGQALALARDYDTTLTALLVTPAIPASLDDYRDLIRETLAEKFMAAVRQARQATGMAGLPDPVAIGFQEGDLHAVRIIRRVMQDGHGLVVKAAEARGDHAGLRSLDMELLRKCPAPVWLHRPGISPAAARRIAVAIDPESDTPEARALSLEMLRLCREIADSHKAQMHVVSCWDFPLEDVLRDSVRANIDGNELTKVVLQARDLHYQGLQRLIREANVDGITEVHHLRGEPGRRIPRFIDEQEIGLLVMGTLGRTGIPGFVIGNTAENIVQALSCSLLALKPAGFVSPVPAQE